MSPKRRRASKGRSKPSGDETREPQVQEPIQSPKQNESGFNVKPDGIAIGLLLALAALYFLPALIAGNSRILSLEGTDIWNQYFYWRHFGFNALLRGEIPLWNPYIFSGTPYVAGIQSAVFYPLNIIYLFFHTAFAINLSIALHCFLASFFTFLFARYLGLRPPSSFLSAITFAYGAPYFLHIFPGHLSNLSTMPWLPALFLSLESFLRNKRLKYVLLGGVALALQVFAGHPQYLFYSMIAVAFYFAICLWLREELRQKRYLLGGFALLLLTGFALSAVQLGPTLELIRLSARESLSYEWVSIFSFPPENLVTLFFPDLFGDLVNVPYWGKNYLWEASLYFGVVPSVLAVVALGRRQFWPVKTFFLIALVSLLLALGKHTPVLWLLYHYVPGFDLFRGISKFVFVYSFAIAITAGCGLDTLATWARQRSLNPRRLGFALLAAAALLVLLAIAVSYAHEAWSQWVKASIEADPRDSPLPALTDPFFVSTSKSAALAIFRTAGIAALFGGLLLIFIKVKKAAVNFLTVPLIVLTAADLWGFGYRYLVTFDPAGLRMDRGLKAFLEKDPDPFRLAVPILPDVNMGMLEGIENVGGYDAIVLRSYSELINFALKAPLDQPNMIMGISTVSPIFDLLNVKYYALPSSKTIEHPELAPIYHNDRYNVYRNDRALPRSFIVHTVRLIKEREAILRAMANPAFNPALVAIVEKFPKGLPNDPALRSPLPRISEKSLNRVLIQAELSAAGLLVLGDAYYPGWKAYVDGKETEIYRTNHVMRGVLVPEGNHVVDFRYEPLSFMAGALVSVTSLVLLVGFFILARAKAW
jgi:hypothetical protein